MIPSLRTDEAQEVAAESCLHKKSISEVDGSFWSSWKRERALHKESEEGQFSSVLGDGSLRTVIKYELTLKEDPCAYVVFQGLAHDLNMLNCLAEMKEIHDSAGRPDDSGRENEGLCLMCWILLGFHSQRVLGPKLMST